MNYMTSLPSSIITQESIYPKSSTLKKKIQMMCFLKYPFCPHFNALKIAEIEI